MTRASQKPTLDEVGCNPKRPPLANLGEYLQTVTTDRRLKGVTRIGAFSASYWRNLEAGECDTFDLDFEASTEAMEPTNAIEIHIAAGVTPAIARAILKAVSRELKGTDSLELLTPIEAAPVAGDIDNLPF